MEVVILVLLLSNLQHVARAACEGVVGGLDGGEVGVPQGDGVAHVEGVQGKLRVGVYSEGGTQLEESPSTIFNFISVEKKDIYS